MEVIYPDFPSKLAPIFMRESERFRIIEDIIERVPRGEHEYGRVWVITVKLSGASVEIGVPIVV